jgi:hypothetical protein
VLSIVVGELERRTRTTGLDWVNEHPAGPQRQPSRLAPCLCRLHYSQDMCRQPVKESTGSPHEAPLEDSASGESQLVSILVTAKGPPASSVGDIALSQ